MTTAGYSGTPLVKKLGIKARGRVFVSSAPANYRKLVAPLPDEAKIVAQLDDATGLVDIKVCAVDDVWSALKLVVRKEHR